MSVPHPRVAQRGPGPGRVWCCEFELSGAGGLTSVVERTVETVARVLVRLHGEPIGYVTLPCPQRPAEVTAVLAAAWHQLHTEIVAHLRADGIAPPSLAAGGRVPSATPRCPDLLGTAEPVSVVVCSRDRSAMLEPCLARLAALEHPAVEFIVVDNAPSDDSTRRLVHRVAATDPRFRYECEPRPGLSHARNRGWRVARGTYVAYTDDDVSVDRHWVRGLVKGFHRRADVRCVTGLVCTASITNDAESYFDARTSSWGARCAPRLFDLSPDSGQGFLYPYSPGIFGTGASFAFLRSCLVELGGFDEALGAGTSTRGGEDLDMFVRVLTAGGAIAYEPAALVWHHHRADTARLAEQMYGYGTGLTALLTKLLLQPSTRLDVLRRIPVGALRLGRIRADTNRRLSPGTTAHRAMLSREFAGYLAGPVLYARSRRRLRRQSSAANPEEALATDVPR